MKDKRIGKRITEGESESLAFGRLLGTYAKPGDTFCFTGELGSGKTVIVRGLAEGMGIQDEVTSPTFALLHVYDGTIPMYHFDVYRLERQEMVLDIGYDDYMGRDGVAVIEWADLIPDFLPDNYIRIDIKRELDHTDRRIICLYQKGAGMDHVVAGLGMEVRP